MRILAIRGRNLTSLAGDFELALNRPPLDKLGLFAITGATGAGKSTLLDAMCLALFDSTPRLAESMTVRVGRADEEDTARLHAHDVRGLLRRGAAEGFAEVDFLGRDGHTYRARWAVRRARNRADGRFQDQELSLVDVGTGQVLGSKKGEVLKAIEDRLGLSFDQFRRSALLAQGEFSAFLRAKSDKRAELLERMTGTEVYGRVSMAAHQRWREAQKELEALRRGAEAIALMPEDARQVARDGLVREEAALAEAAAKAGVVNLTRAAALECAGQGIRVNCIAPGFIATPMTDALNEKQREGILKSVPAGKLGRPDDIAAACVYLASDEAGYVTGQTLHVNGGMAMI